MSLLEIGVWYGIGSTNIWLEYLQPGSNVVLMDSWKPYASQLDLDDKEWGYKQMDDLSTDAYLSCFLNVKKFENEHWKKNIKISTIRADSQYCLPTFKDDYFDFIYIDGDHKYEKVKSDIKQAKRLINKKYGIICGDDLDKIPTPELLKIAKNHKNLDALRGDYQFHPGVMLAVSEEFKIVNMANSFWWIVCVNGKFDDKILKNII